MTENPLLNTHGIGVGAVAKIRAFHTDLAADVLKKAANCTEVLNPTHVCAN